MKTGTYFVKQKTRIWDWARPGRLSGVYRLALVLALTGASSAQAAGINANSMQTVTPQIQLVSVNRTGTNGSGGLNGGVGEYTISANGRFVAFTTFASDLVTNDTNGGAGRPIQDVFIRDLQTETTTLVSVNRFGADSGNDNSGSPSISANGRFVAFSSDASDLVATSSGSCNIPARGGNVFVRDLQTGATVLASVNRAGTDCGNGGSVLPSISADGRFVAFLSHASNLVANDTNGQQDVFVRDLQTGTTVQASINHAGTNGGNGVTGTPLLSANGRFVAFASQASDLVATDTNGTWDIFVRDLQMAKTTLVSVNWAGTNSGNGRSGNVPVGTDFAVSPDGRFVAFFSAASDLVATDTNGADDVFMRDLQTRTTTLVSFNRAGTNSGNHDSLHPSLSADGRFVAFESLASDLVTTDSNGTDDVFVRDLQAGTTTLVSVNRTGTNSGNHGAFFGRPSPSSMSADGRFVAFSSQSSDLVATDTKEGVINVFVRDLQTRTTMLASVNRAGTDSGNNASEYPVLSADGRFVVFTSASGLVANDTNGQYDLYAAQITTNVPFAAFKAKAEIDLRHRPHHDEFEKGHRPRRDKFEDEFEMTATFTLGPNNNGIAPLTEAVTVQVGTFSTTIPAGSFRLKKGRFTFEGVIDGVKLEAVLRSLILGNDYEFTVEGKGADLTGTENPVTAGLTIGDDSGSKPITAKFK